MELTPAVVEQLVTRLFAAPDRGAATAMLSEHARHANHPEVVRVQVAVLKLSDGQPDRLRQMLTHAMNDYRDVLAWAEYPAQTVSPVTGLTAAQKTELIQADEGQYLAWLGAHIDDAS